MKEKYGEEFEILNGFHDNQLNYTDFIDNFIDKDTVADASIDANANARNKDICSLENEMSKPHMKLLSYNKIFHDMTKMYGLKTAREWLENEWSGSFYLHDAASSSFKPYCFSYDLERLVTEGQFFTSAIDARPPQHLVTYTDFVGEYVSYTSNRTSGEFAPFNFFSANQQGRLCG